MRRWLTVCVMCSLVVAGAEAALADVAAAEKALARGRFERARSLFSPAAQAGNARAQYELGRLLLDKGKFPSGLRWIRSSVKTGYVPALVKLGRLSWWGMYFPADKSAAVRLWEKAIAHKDLAAHPLEASYARLYLFNAYRKGEGARVDTKRSLTLLREAADSGNERAQYEYGLVLDAGDGVAPDIVEAHKYLVLAWKQDYALTRAWGRVVPSARGRALALRKDMSASDVATSKKRVRAWLDAQKAGKLGRVFGREAAQSTGRRELAENEWGWERLFATLHAFSGAVERDCSRRFLRSRAREGGGSSAEMFTMECCGEQHAFRVQLNLQGNKLVSFGVSYAGER